MSVRMYHITNEFTRSLPYDNDVIREILGIYWNIPNVMVGHTKYGGMRLEMITHQTIMPDDVLNIPATRYVRQLYPDMEIYGPAIVLQNCHYEP